MAGRKVSPAPMQMIADDGGGKERLCPSLYAQGLGAQTADFLYGREEANHLGGENPHHHTHQRHDGHA